VPSSAPFLTSLHANGLSFSVRLYQPGGRSLRLREQPLFRKEKRHFDGR
jgi:hypothetical protein